MQLFDWIVLIVTLLFIVIYGAWKTKGSKNVEDFILGSNETPWHIVGLSVMATQASAITFLSTPGQAYHDGMGFVQFYFGLPIAMVVICVTFIPIYHKYKVYTAYEYLEKRFDLKTRSLAALLFLFQRGLGTGLTIYAPAIILSALLGWNLTIYEYYYWCFGNHIYFFWWNKSGKRNPKTANVCDHVGNDYYFFSDFTLLAK